MKTAKEKLIHNILKTFKRITSMKAKIMDLLHNFVPPDNINAVFI